MNPSPIASFARSFSGASPTHLVTAPGRVNVIGEHTDYNGYPVLPCALRRAIRIAFTPRDDARVVAHSPLPEFGRREFLISQQIEPSPTGDWANYLKAAAQGLARHYGEGVRWRGFDAVVVGDIPRGAGLSSSSALVVATALALLAANERAMPLLQLADLMADAEHYVGTAGGGMDQAVCLRAVEGHALRIDFFPLRVMPIPMPPDVAIVVANSLVKAEKTGKARLKYNRRPLECRLATMLLAEKMGRRVKPDAIRLAELFPEVPTGEARETILAMLSDEPYTTARLAAELRMDEATLARNALTMPDGTVFPEPEDGFHLKKRVRHVLTEAERVHLAAEAIQRGDVERVGQLMDASHTSCRDEYHISTPELEQLVKIMRRAGALGARLTGAGFGGCAIALVRLEDAPQVCEAVREAYYADSLGLAEPPPEFGTWDDVLFVTDAGPGACVQRFDS